MARLVLTDAILEGKRVIAPPREVQEVRNAFLAYDRFATWNPALEDDLLAAHALLMAGLVERPGAYRSREHRPCPSG